MRLPVAFIALAGCSTTADHPGTGTVVFSEGATGYVHTLDVASGQDRLIDGTAAFGSLSISSDGQHVAYVGADSVVRVADAAGSVTQLAPPNGATDETGCVPGPTWGPNSSLAYCIYDQGYSSYGFMPAPGVPARKLLATELVISDDASTIVYHRRDPDPTKPGDVVVENADGSGQRVVAASTIETQFHFTPDGQQIVAVAQLPDAAHVVVHSLTSGTTTDLGPGTLPVAIEGGSMISPDHTEIVAVLAGELVAVQLATGATRPFATVASDVTINQASFIDADHVAYVRVRDTTQGDIVTSTSSFRIASASDDVAVVPDTTLDCYVQDIAIDRGVAALECDTAEIVGLDGTVRASTAAPFALGISEDSAGIVTLDDNGTVAFVTPDGVARTLAQATAPHDITGTRLGPFAAYAP